MVQRGGGVTNDVQRLRDEADIRTLTARYARGVDRLDWDLVRSCYHDDAVDVHGGRTFNVDELIEYLRERLSRSAATVHFLGNQLIELDGDVAWAETYCLARHRDPVPGGSSQQDLEQFVRYVDRVERRGGQWRFASRTVVYEPGRVDPVTEDSPFAAVSSFRGVRDRSDLAYYRDA
jgi:hypothetical protein